MVQSSRPRYRGRLVRACSSGVAVVALALLAACGSSTLPKVLTRASPSPSALPIPGHVVFADSFTNPKAGWTTSPFDAETYPAGGGYLLTADGGTDAYGEAPYSSASMDGVAVTATAVENAGDPLSGYFGVGCDLGDPSAQYQFVVDAKGDYYIDVADHEADFFHIVDSGHIASMRAAGVADEIQGSCTHTALNDGTTAVSLRLSINGVAVASVVDTSPTEGTTWGGGVLVTSPASPDLTVTALFTSFSMTDLATPVTPVTNPVVYSDSLGNPDTDWDTHKWAADQTIGYGAGAYDITADGWVDSPSPQVATLVSAEARVTVKVVRGGAETLSGVFCAPSEGDPQYIFFASVDGSWEIDTLPSVKRAPVPILTGHFAIPRGAKSVTVGGSCSPVSSAAGRSTTRLVIVVDGKQMGTTKAVAAGSPHPWQTGLMIVTFQGDPAATVAFTNFAITQLTP
jgi:hypothetical protein